jgi:hypothetical protein
MSKVARGKLLDKMGRQACNHPTAGARSRGKNKGVVEWRRGDNQEMRIRSRLGINNILVRYFRSAAALVGYMNGEPRDEHERVIEQSIHRFMSTTSAELQERKGRLMKKTG